MNQESIQIGTDNDVVEIQGKRFPSDRANHEIRIRDLKRV